jgi:hypothetical protein
MVRTCMTLASAWLLGAALSSAALGQVPSAVSERISFAAAGDLLGPYRPTLQLDDPMFSKVVAIFHGADVGFANEEGSTFDMATFTGWLGAENGGGYPLHTLAVARAFKAMGISLISRANNHATDWGTAGMLASDAALDAIGIVHAGTGRSLEAARAAAYLESPAGRVALVASASTFPGMSPAGDPGRGAGPRPGLNPLHVQRVTLVTAREMGELSRIARRESGGDPGRPYPATRRLRLDDQYFELSERPGITYDVSDTDRSAIIHSIFEARRSADFVVYSIHAHETLTGNSDEPAPADFLPPLFHSVIDAGADVVLRSGPHVLGGIEIYKGKPIFYGLGSLFFDLPRGLTVASEGPAADRVTLTFPPSWYDSAVAVSDFQGGKLTRVLVYPLMLETTEGARRGLPRRAFGADARRILETIRRCSAVFGTQLRIVSDVGIVDAPPGA